MKKIFIAVLLSLIVLSNQSVLISNAQQISNTTSIAPYSDVYVTRYRVNNGKLQKRRWNETKGVWADPYWAIHLLCCFADQHSGSISPKVLPFLL